VTTPARLRELCQILERWSMLPPTQRRAVLLGEARP
jgi:hypothetical protein